MYTLRELIWSPISLFVLFLILWFLLGIKCSGGDAARFKFFRPRVVPYGSCLLVIWPDVMDSFIFLFSIVPHQQITFDRHYHVFRLIVVSGAYRCHGDQFMHYNWLQLVRLVGAMVTMSISWFENHLIDVWNFASLLCHSFVRVVWPCPSG